jgi:hypothetical protein
VCVTCTSGECADAEMERRSALELDLGTICRKASPELSMDDIDPRLPGCVTDCRPQLAVSYAKSSWEATRKMGPCV